MGNETTIGTWNSVFDANEKIHAAYENGATTPEALMAQCPDLDEAQCLCWIRKEEVDKEAYHAI